jgi:hypothetical protein
MYHTRSQHVDLRGDPVSSSGERLVSIAAPIVAVARYMLVVIMRLCVRYPHPKLKYAALIKKPRRLSVIARIPSTEL